MSQSNPIILTLIKPECIIFRFVSHFELGGLREYTVCLARLSTASFG
jgi:hypothetical protein